MTALASSLKATRHRATEDDPIAGLKRAQADYKAVRTGFQNRQRQISRMCTGASATSLMTMRLSQVHEAWARCKVRWP